MTIETAIEKAVRGGYKDRKYQTFSDSLLDPEWWRCLGKEMGWEAVDVYDTDAAHDADWDRKVQAGWLYHWHRLIDTLSQGGTTEEFFAKLKWKTLTA